MKGLQSTDGPISQVDCEHFFEHALAGFLIADSENIIRSGNSRFANWIEATVDEIKGKRFSDLLSIGSKIYYETHLSPLLRMQGFFEEVLLELSIAPGKKLKVLVNALLYKNDDDKTQGLYYTITKATDRLQYEQNLQYAKTNAEKKLEVEKENVLLREQLMAVLGHDLRNPLGAITMAVQLLLGASLQPSHNEILAIIKRSSYRMSELIANIMDFAKTRLGEGILIVPHDVILQPVLQHVIDEMKLVFPKREVIGQFNMQDPVRCDADRISQLFSNLLANALTHGDPETKVHIQASHIDNVFELTVTNNGVPIPESLHELLFEPFTREGDRRSKNGLGLGLYIAAEIASAHNGSLTFTSIGDETRFTFSMVS